MMRKYDTTCDSCGKTISALEPSCSFCHQKEKDSAKRAQEMQSREQFHITDDFGQTIEVKVKKEGGKEYFEVVKEKKLDKSIPTVITMMVFFGLIGSAMGGLAGLVDGAIFGFAVTALVYAAQDSFK